MGKKKIQAQSEEEVLKEVALQEAVRKKSVQKLEKIESKKTTKGHVNIQSTYNNTIIIFTDPNGNVLAWSSAGSLGFKGPKKSTPFAASKVIESLSEKAKKIGLRELKVFVKGIGSGREAAIRALASRGFDIISIKDITPVPHNGCRPPKPRRV